MKNVMVKVLWSTVLVGNMKEVGLQTSGKAKDLRDIQIIILIMASSELEKPMARVFTLGLMVRCMMGSGFKAVSRAMVFGEVSIMIIILANGFSLKHMDMEFIIGQMVIDMKVNGEWVWNMELVLMIFRMETSIRVSMQMENRMEKDSINGFLVKFILENFFWERDKAKVNGGVIKLIYTIKIPMKGIF